MITHRPGVEQKLRKDMAKTAVALATRNRWAMAVAVNDAILSAHPADLEACNRMGKALTELGRNKEAKEAFRRALEISPNNTIAQKNLARLMQIDEDAPRKGVHTRASHAFIEESGKAIVTSLISLTSPKTLLNMAPGHTVQLKSQGRTIRVDDPSGECLGKVEPKLASRLARLMSGGNRYEATVTTVSEQELTVIIRETYRHPSQAATMSFPSSGVADFRVYMPGSVLGADLGDFEPERDSVAVKDWSDDDTEPGDEEAFSPAVHRIINPDSENAGT